MSHKPQKQEFDRKRQQVESSEDPGDGSERSTGPISGYYSTKQQAESAAKGKGWYGGNGWVSEATAVVINDETYILASPHAIDLDGIKKALIDRLRLEALSKLTPEEIAALGVKGLT